MAKLTPESCKQSADDLVNVVKLIPPLKRAPVFSDVQGIHHTLEDAARASILLSYIRKYFLDLPDGESLPFVKKIDEIVPRAS